MPPWGGRVAGRPAEGGDVCGRFGLSATSEVLADWLELDPDELPLFSPRYNIAPGQDALVVRPRADRRMAVRHVRWGLLPSSSGGRAGPPLINGRVETAATRPAFREAFARRRCLVVADGFYEWQRTGAKKRTPWHVGLRGGGIFALGGVWERWRDADSGETVDTFAILTTRPNPLIAELHDRMPVIVPRHGFDRWLDRELGGADVGDLTQPRGAEGMEAWRVSERVGNVRFDDPECRAPLG
jgi:putative SOS response-associated peptidase YedK